MDGKDGKETPPEGGGEGNNTINGNNLEGKAEGQSSSVNLLEKLREQFTGLFFGGFADPEIFTASQGGRPHGHDGADRAPTEEHGNESATEKASALEGISKFSMRPQDIRDYLQRFVIRQEEAKKVLAVTICDHYNHVRRCLASPKELIRDYGKPNVLLLGPTGVGKTYLIRNLAKLLGVPFVKADATKFTETGYVGNDVEEMVRDLVRAANGDVELAQYGIIFVDEIDKIASNEAMGRDVSGRGVQVNLLKLMEDAEVSCVAPNDITAQMSAMVTFGGRRHRRESISTRHILFIVSGAFDRLNELVRRRSSAGSIGFTKKGFDDGGEDYLRLATTADFVQFGLEPEFIGRLPVRVACEHLRKKDLAQILISSEGSILRQYEKDFEGYGIELTLTEEAIYAIAGLAEEEKTGARGLMTVLERLFRDFKFHLPSTTIRRLNITEEIVRDPTTALRKLLADSSAQAEDIQRIHFP
ncbi:MAG: AAA family ATPase [Puniceicoccales bacterium]|jgi:endopeptidase Clp ATP-binding regulatory subunit ClpX|nr:AAA family ATPase [Puniceicoccales bacterium]